MSPIALSLYVASIATLVAALLGIALAAALSSRRFPGRDAVEVVLTLPMVLPPTVLGYYLLVALGRRSALGQVFESLTGHAIVFTRTGAVIAAVVAVLPIVVKSARASLEEVDPDLVAAARTLGASPWRAFLTVRLPLAAPGIVAALMLAVARALGDFGATLMVAGNIPGETRTASLAIYDAIQAQRDDDAFGLVVALTLVAAVILYAADRTTRRARAT